MVRKAASRILIYVFIFGIFVELFYILPIILKETNMELVLEKAVTGGITISILIFLVVTLNRQNKLIKKISELKANIPPRSSTEISKEISSIEDDLDALNIVRRDGLMSDKEYGEKSEFLKGEIKKKKQELRSVQKEERKTRKEKKKEELTEKKEEHKEEPKEKKEEKPKEKKEEHKEEPKEKKKEAPATPEISGTQEMEPSDIEPEKGL
jgi:hypothetical protein